MGREYPKQDYWPSCKVRLIIRFEEFGAKSSVPKPAVRTLNRKGGEVKSTNVKPAEATSSADGFTQEIVGIIPKSAQLGRNGLRQAGSLSFDIKYADFPLDPRTVRSCAVECYMGTVTADDFEKGIMGGTRTVTNSGNETAEPLHMVPDTFIYNNKKRSNLRFQGWADNIEVSWSDKEPLVRFECSDNTRILIDQEAPPQLTLSASDTIDKAINDYMANFPQFAGLKAKFLPEGATAPTMADAMGKASGKTASKHKHKGPSPDSNPSVWDYFTDCVRMIGYSIRIGGTDVIIQRIRTLLKEGYESRPDDPFAGGRKLPSGVEVPRRLFIYGRNLTELTVKRNFTRHAPTNVEVFCYDSTRKQRLVARHPLKIDRQMRKQPGDKGDEVWKVYPVQGVTNETTLAIIAQEYYEQLNRSEMEIHCVTKNMGSYGGGNADPDVLDLMPGDGIDVELQRSSDDEKDPSMTVADQENKLAVKARAVDYLTGLGFPDGFAKAYAEAFAASGALSAFYTRKVGIEWSEDDAYTISIDAVNYVAARADVEAPKDAEPPKEESAPAPTDNVQVEED